MKTTLKLILVLFFTHIVLYSQSFTTIVEPFIVNNSSESLNNLSPSIEANNAHDFFVAWHQTLEANSNETDNYIQISKFNNSGVPYQEEPTLIDLSSFHVDGSYGLLNPKIHLNKEKSELITTWVKDWGMSRNVIARKLDFELNLLTDIRNLGNCDHYLHIDIKFNDSLTIATWDYWREGMYDACFNIIEDFPSENGSYSCFPRIAPLREVRKFKTSGLIDDENLLVLEVLDFPGQDIYANYYNIYDRKMVLDSAFIVDDVEPYYSLDDVKVIDFDNSNHFVVWTISSDSSRALIDTINIKKYHNYEPIGKNSFEPSGMLSDDNIFGSPSNLEVLRYGDGFLLLYETKTQVNCLVVDSDLKKLGKYVIHEKNDKTEKNFNYSLQDSLVYMTWEAGSYATQNKNIWAKVVAMDQSVDVKQETKLPNEYALMQNYPNPFNPQTRITFSLAKTSMVELKIFDVLGREVKTLVNSEMSIGHHEVEWDGRDNYDRQLSSGIYFYRIDTGEFTQTRKMMLMK